jgi:hypothetical protein
MGNSKKIAFVNDAAEREYKALPKDVQTEFGTSLRAVQDNKKPFLPIDYLSNIGAGVIELKINGSPGFRCVYIAKYLDYDALSYIISVCLVFKINLSLLLATFNCSLVKLIALLKLASSKFVFLNIAP